MQHQLGSTIADEATLAPRTDVRSARGNLLVKRLLDIGLSVAGGVVATPLWLAAIVAILLEDGPPVLFRQKRWGRSETKFDVLKFRTMRKDADAVRQATVGDARITRVGRVLRACGMDELPQVLNIIKGDMSLVGPRALAVGEIIPDHDGRDLTYEQVPGFAARLAVRPGLTGPAAIYLSKDAHPLDKLREDLRYVRERTLLYDIKLILLSFWISVSGRWERRDKKVGG